MKYWETIADNPHNAGWSLGWVSAVDREGRTIWIADAHQDDGKRFVVRVDEKLTAFLAIGEVGLYPPVERTTLTIIAAMAESVSLQKQLHHFSPY